MVGEEAWIFKLIHNVTYLSSGGNLGVYIAFRHSVSPYQQINRRYGIVLCLDTSC